MAASTPRQAPKEDPLEAEGHKGFCDYVLIGVSIFLCLVFPPMWFAVWRIVKHYERAVIYRLGKLKSKKPSGPGLFIVIPCTDDYHLVDLRTLTFDVRPQELLTKDSVTCQVDAVVYYNIFDAVASATRVRDVHYSTRLLAQTSLRNCLSSRTLAEILSDGEAIAEELGRELDVATDAWGVKVVRVDIKDVKIPNDMQRSMAAEAEAAREAKAKVIAAQGEKDSACALKEAAELISKSGGALQLRYLQTLNTIAAEKNSTIVFPLPMNLLSEKK